MKSTGEALDLVRRTIREMRGYVPGLQPSPGQRLVKLNTNENPYPPSQSVLQALSGAVNDTLRLYPSPDAAPVRKEAAERYGISASQVLCGNGSDEILALIMRAFVDEGDAIAYFEPSYSLYPVLAGIAGARTVVIPWARPREASDVGRTPIPTPRAKVFFLTTPNSPYGSLFPTSWIRRLLDAFSGIVIADEAYVDFATESALPLLAEYPRLICVRSLSKSYSLAGLRAGLALASEELIAQIAKVKDSYNVNRLSQAAAAAAIADEEYRRQTSERIKATRARLSRRLTDLGLVIPPTQANFLFAALPNGSGTEKPDAGPLARFLLERGFLVRHFDTPTLRDGMRISIGTDQEIDALADAIEEGLRGRQ
ncbi:MAG TPA: histidinol-phosphate transaminase [Spirochaetia bacterium]|nr:histidinol-phosphate transaminase [Spirochaetia bacterium]